MEYVRRDSYIVHLLTINSTVHHGRLGCGKIRMQVLVDDE